MQREKGTQVVTFYISKTKLGDGRWYDCLDFIGKLSAETICSYHVCIDGDIKVTWGQGSG